MGWPKKYACFFLFNAGDRQILEPTKDYANSYKLWRKLVSPDSIICENGQSVILEIK